MKGCTWHLIAMTFGMHLDGDATVIGQSGDGAHFFATPVISYRASPLVSGSATVSNAT